MTLIRAAIIDLGTNTFHLLITEWDESAAIKILYRKRYFVKLASVGIDLISPDSLDRALDALSKIKHTIDTYQVNHIEAVGTAALRTARNADLFVKEVWHRFGIKIKVISGHTEAMLIYHGVSQIWDSNKLPALIMDIGGGSVEFILADKQKVYWYDSFPIGVAVLCRSFHKSDPMAISEVEELRRFTSPYLKKLSAELQAIKPQMLIGASGTFDVLSSFVHENHPAPFSTVRKKEIDQALEYLVHSTLKQRFNNPKIPTARVDMIVVAAVLLQSVLEIMEVNQVGISTYALKEGILRNLVEPKIKF